MSSIEDARDDSTDKPSTFHALRHRDFRLLWLGQAISVTGSQMQLVAINWHVYLLTKSPLALGGVGLVRVVPIILCSLIGGVAADSLDRKRVMYVTQSVMLVSAIILSTVTAFGVTNILPIYLLTAMNSAALAFDNPARQSLLPRLVPASEFPNAVSLGLIVFQVATIAGPSIAGLILSKYGPTPIYAINAFSFLAVIAALFLMHASGAPEKQTGDVKVSTLESLREGLRFVWRTPIIVQTMTLDFIATFFASATALLPIFADKVLNVGAHGLGFLASAPAAGSVLAALMMARLRIVHHQGKIVVAAVAVYGAATVGFGLSKIFWLSLLMLAITGAADTVSTVLRQTIRQLVTPDNLRGRMTSVNMIFFMGGPQLGELEAGALAAVMGVELSVIAGGAGCLIAVALTVWKAKNLLRYDGVTQNEIQNRE